MLWQDRVKEMKLQTIYYVHMDTALNAHTRLVVRECPFKTCCDFLRGFMTKDIVCSEGGK